jgi:hypothetical protein
MNQTNKAATAPAAKTTKTGPDEGMSRLCVGDVYKDAKGIEMVVWFLNPSRACVVPLASPIQHRTDDQGVIRFIAGKGSENISPDSLVEVTRRLGRKGLADEIDNRDKQSAEETMKVKTAKKPSKGAKTQGTGTPGIRAGSLGTYEGYSIASVVRRLASEGWTTPEIRALFQAKKIECSDQTIKLNVYRGVRPKYHKDFQLAPLTKDQIPAKPKVEAAPAKAPAKAAAKPAAKVPAKAAAAPAKKTGTGSAKAAPKAAAKKPAVGAASSVKLPGSPAEQIAALKKAKAAKAAAPAPAAK